MSYIFLYLWHLFQFRYTATPNSALKMSINLTFAYENNKILQLFFTCNILGLSS